MLRNMYVDKDGKVLAFKDNTWDDYEARRKLTFIGTINDVQHKYVEIDEEYRSHDM